MKNYTISNHFLSTLLSRAEDLGIDVGEILDKCNLNPEVLRSDRARISVDQLSRVINLLWYLTDDEFLGFTSRRQKVGTMLLMAHLAVAETNLKSAFNISSKFYKTIGADFDFDLDFNSPEEAKIVFNFVCPDLDVSHILKEFIMISIHRFFSWLIDKSIVLSSANFTHPRPSHIDEYKYLFPCAHVFSQPKDSIVFASSFLKEPVVRNKEELKLYFRRAPVDIFLKPENDTSLTTRIRRLIEAELFDGFPTFDEVSVRINMTPQTLRRRLKQEGSSYQEIKNLIRRDMAIHLLTNLDLSLSDIAEKIGFTEAGAFIRAFKSWTGVTPGDYRRNA